MRTTVSVIVIAHPIRSISPQPEILLLRLLPVEVVLQIRNTIQDGDPVVPANVAVPGGADAHASGFRASVQWQQWIFIIIIVIQGQGRGRGLHHRSGSTP